MASKTQISWTDATYNPWYGCRRVSAGCKFCYADRDMSRYGMNFRKVTRSKTTFKDPLKWKEPQRVFTCSWSDFFIEDADEWRQEVWQIIKQPPHLTYQILTKRPGRIAQCFPDDWGQGYPNVWIGVSVESDRVLERLVTLSMIPAVVRFASFEPLLSQLTNLQPLFSSMVNGKPLHESIHWAIMGGESGNESGKFKYRDSELSWYVDIASTCKRLGIPVFMKQLGTGLAKKLGASTRVGSDMEDLPIAIRVRDFPHTDADSLT